MQSSIIHLLLLSIITIHIHQSITINRDIATIDPTRCEHVIDECLVKSPYVIRRFSNQSVMSWNEARALCLNPNDDEVDGMATLDTSIKTLSISSLDEQFSLLREICATLKNNDGRYVNCWVGGKLNDAQDGYIFATEDTNHLDYSPALRDSNRWGCVRNTDGSCKKDIEGIFLDNSEDYIILFQNRDYYFADWPKDGGTNPDFQVTAVVCNNKKFDYVDPCQCFCDSCDIYGDPHVNTFDGVQFHTKGKCAYHAVTPCNLVSSTVNGQITTRPDFNADFPIEISTENVECFNGFSSCLHKLYLSLYDINGTLQTVIKFEHQLNQGTISTVVEYINEGELQLSGDVELDKLQTWIETPPSDDEPWSFILKRIDYNYELAIYTHTKYQTANIQFRDLSSLNVESLYLSSVRITLSSCFAGSTCGICGKYDGYTFHELTVRDEITNSLTPINTNYSVSNPFDKTTTEIINRFTSHWINSERSIASNLDETCNDINAGLCKLDYCSDECICNSSTQQITTYNRQKQLQCDHDLAACLGFKADSIECIEWQNNENLSKQQYLTDNAPHCLHLVNTYCCYDIFCPEKPDICDFSTTPTTEEPTARQTISATLVPTESPSNHPIDTPKPSHSPTLQPSQSPTMQSSPNPTETPSTKPTLRPTLSPIIDNQCVDASNLDIVFLVDNSCGLPYDECVSQQVGISEFLASIKYGSDPRVAYITYGSPNQLDVVVPIDDVRYNDISSNNFRTRSRRRRQYINTVKSLDCGSEFGSDATDLLHGLNAAIEELTYGVNSETMGRDRKIVIFSNCEDNTNQIDPCSVSQGDGLIIEDKPVEITIINIKSAQSAEPRFPASTYLKCLAEDENERFIVIPNTNINSFENSIDQFVSAVCENDTPSPSSAPTESPLDSTSSPSKNPTITQSATPTTTPSNRPTSHPTNLPTTSPSEKPTHSPLETSCGFDYVADIVFVVDMSCGLNEDQCMKQQDMISDIMQRIKTSNQPRIGYIDCDIALSGDKESAIQIKLNDVLFNNRSQEPDEGSLRKLYFESIANRLSCNQNATVVPRAECLDYALDEFKRNELDTDTKRKLVIFSVCKTNDDVCRLQQRIIDEDIEVILVNIGIQYESENLCLLRDIDNTLVFRIDDVADMEMVKDNVTNAICREPTPIPTDQPTKAPTNKPTDNPTNKPTTRRPTKKPTNKPTTTWPTKKPTNQQVLKWNFGSDSDSNSDDSDSDSDDSSRLDGSFHWQFQQESSVKTRWRRDSSVNSRDSS